MSWGHQYVEFERLFSESVRGIFHNVGVLPICVTWQLFLCPARWREASKFLGNRPSAEGIGQAHRD